MKDTAFSVPASKLNRLAAIYQFNPDSKKLDLFDSLQCSEYSRPPAFESGAGGLVSTADDYHAFLGMLLNKGLLGAERILSGASVEMMTHDQLTPEQKTGADLFFGNHSSWGFGVGVNVLADTPWSVPGRFGWTGGFGTTAFADPTNDSIGILLTQRLMDSPEPPAVFKDFYTHTGMRHI
jgi:CubicO group peptidase (beta-lactamase class C family)